MNYNYTYDSSRMLGELECAIKRERYDSPVVPYLVLFSQEGVYLEADADGNAVLYQRNYFDFTFYNRNEVKDTTAAFDPEISTPQTIQFLSLIIYLRPNYNI